MSQTQPSPHYWTLFTTARLTLLKRCDTHRALIPWHGALLREESEHLHCSHACNASCGLRDQKKMPQWIKSLSLWMVEVGNPLKAQHWKATDEISKSPVWLGEKGWGRMRWRRWPSTVDRWGSGSRGPCKTRRKTSNKWGISYDHLTNH